MKNYTTKSYELGELTKLTQKTQNELKSELLAESNICRLCEREIQKPVLDHQHMTNAETIGQNGAGLIRGVICNNCNVVLGKIENNSKRYLIHDLPKYLKNVITYLEQPNLPYIHTNETRRLREPLKKSDYNKMIKALAEISGRPTEFLHTKYPYNKFYNKTLEKLRNLSKS